MPGVSLRRMARSRRRCSCPSERWERVKGVPQDTLEELGVQILLNNTYHLYLRPGVETVRELGGVQKFMAWERPILTDSGGFQVFSLSDLRKVTEDGVSFRSHLDGSSHFFSPESAIAAEIGLGADIIMAFDECTEYPADRSRAQASMEMTLRWARRSKEYFEAHKEDVPWFRSASLFGAGEKMQIPRSARDDKNSWDDKHDNAGFGTAEALPVQSNSEHSCNIRVSGEERRAKSEERPIEPGQTQALFGIVQGGTYPDLRRESAERTVEIDFPGYAIGGLSVGEPREMTYEMVNAAMPYLPCGQAALLDGCRHAGRDRAVRCAGCGHDGLRVTDPRRASRPAVYVGGASHDQERALCEG